MGILALLLFVAMGANGASARDFPLFDVQQICENQAGPAKRIEDMYAYEREALKRKNMTPTDVRQAVVNSCIDGEQLKYDVSRIIWWKVSEEDQVACYDRARFQPAANYSILYFCLDQAFTIQEQKRPRSFKY